VSFWHRDMNNLLKKECRLIQTVKNHYAGVFYVIAAEKTQSVFPSSQPQWRKKNHSKRRNFWTLPRNS